mmetsp:Transcript_47340/g.112701  ORF Transcript_47340/g.112701 Transcript_47340/m.112701 type:complete len:230 (+) Transcript_47340:395-1084(+)
MTAGSMAGRRSITSIFNTSSEASIISWFSCPYHIGSRVCMLNGSSIACPTSSMTKRAQQTMATIGITRQATRFTSTIGSVKHHKDRKREVCREYEGGTEDLMRRSQAPYTPENSLLSDSKCARSAVSCDWTTMAWNFSSGVPSGLIGPKRDTSASLLVRPFIMMPDIILVTMNGRCRHAHRIFMSVSPRRPERTVRCFSEKVAFVGLYAFSLPWRCWRRKEGKAATIAR